MTIGEQSDNSAHSFVNQDTCCHDRCICHVLKALPITDLCQLAAYVNIELTIAV